jgi:predicted dehydrogenase
MKPSPGEAIITSGFCSYGIEVKTLKIGIAGAGAIAQRNATEAARSGAATIGGVFDVNHKVARDLARALKAPFCASFEALLDTPGLDAVLLSVPHHLHRPMTIQAAGRGKHVLVEKPMANTLADAEEMMDACRRHGVALSVNYSFRYLPKIQKAKELIDAGALGTISGVQIVAQQFKDRGYWMGAQSNSPDDWRASKEKCGGGFLIMTVCHVIDYVYFLTGLTADRIYSEYATLGSPAEVEDIVSVSFRMTNGAVGSLSASSIMRGFNQAEERIWGTHGTLVLNASGLSFWSTRPIDGRRPGRIHSYSKFPDASWTAEWIKGFVTSVQRGDEPPVSFQAGWENLAFITRAYDSMEQGVALKVPAFNGVPEVASV